MTTDLNLASDEPWTEVQLLSATGGNDSVILHGVSWGLYRTLRKMPNNRNIRMTYDRGELEIMSPSAEHEGIASLLGNLITVWCIERNIPLRSCRTLTIRRSILKRGFEPDNCYYVQNEPLVFNKRKLNFKSDPPPDLAIEVEITRRLLSKTQIYAAFKVPELWTWKHDLLTVFELSKDSEYTPRDSSICFPGFPIARVQEVVRQCGVGHETALLRSFRDWVRASAAWLTGGLR